ncbi:glycosyltransferase [Fredinandcohnia sp. FSL W7-1320]|uniref:glycosyltransferase n=1 Tax=Fredinandcohnia sp. FSL W7-1320 TaxID=2954540 RepID=UPI0030FDA43D
MKKLILLTHQYPFNQSEAFLETEIPFLSQVFDEIHIFPINISKSSARPTRELPSNASIHFLNDFDQKGTLKRGKRIVSALFDTQCMKWLSQELPFFKKHGMKGYINALNWISIAKVVKDSIKKELQLELGETIIYSYWQNPGALGAVMLKEHIRIPVVSRAHGGDLYLERYNPAYIPFQFNVIHKLNQLFLISQNGYDYLYEKDQTVGSILEISRLGTLNKNIKATFSDDNILRIVTCSYMVPVKRLHLLLEALKLVDFPVEWRHIGGGPLENELKEKAKSLPSNSKVRFLGNLSNTEVLENYQKEAADLFINVSESEGIPVSIMEAFSCGIPVMATDVGGTSELVDNSSGKLIEKDIKPEKLAKYLTEYRNLTSIEKQKRSTSAFTIWNSRYNAELNYRDFSTRLENILENANESQQQKVYLR